MIRLLLSAIALLCFISLTSCGNDECDTSTWYEDADGDGLGNPDVSQDACDQPDGYVANADDTDDTGSSGGSSECDTPGEAEQSTNTEIEALRQAMLTFRNSLSGSLLDEASVCLDDERVYQWHNTPNAGGTERDGIIYSDLTDEQLNNFKALMQAFLSDEGYQKVDEITFLAEAFLSDQNASVWHPDFYSIDLFGDPVNTGSWGFQLDGHHCAINFLVHADNVSIVPAFLGGEPAKETYNGTDYDIFKDERDLALSLYNALTTDELSSAVSSGNRTMQVGPSSRNGNPDNYRGNYDYSGFETGLKYSDMSAATQANLLLVMQEYVYNLEKTFADEWWAGVMDNIDETYFVWIDDVETPTATTQFYYRIYNPYLWVEYNAEDVVGGSIDSWNHIHTITRIPDNPATDNGGDYGIFAEMVNGTGPKTLYEHYAMADHHKTSQLLFDYKVDMPHSHSGHSHGH